MNRRVSLLRERRGVTFLHDILLSALHRVFRAWSTFVSESRLLRSYALFRFFRRWQRACNASLYRRAELMGRKRLAMNFARVRLERRAFRALACYTFDSQWERDENSSNFGQYADTEWSVRASFQRPYPTLFLHESCVDCGQKLMERQDLGRKREEERSGSQRKIIQPPH